MFEFCPCEDKFKSKIGGVKANEPFSVTLKGEAGEAAVILTKEGAGHMPVRYDMTKLSGEFTVTLCITTPGLYFYYFLIDGTRYAGDEMQELTQGGNDYLQLVYEGDFRPLDGGVIYQIMPDRFFRATGQAEEGVKIQDDWYKMPSHVPDENGKYNTEFFGGNLQGITAKLDYIKSLGVTYIYLNPIFEAASNHRYDTGDYEKIDKLLGSEADFERLISEAKARGIGIILDGVFSHTGDDSKYFNKYGNYDTVGAYQSQQSPYYDWYDFHSYPNKYKCWWGFTSLPEVNENSPNYINYMLGDGGVIDRWEKKGIAGWRLDVADELPNEFLEHLRRRSSVTLIGEVWENAARKFAYGQRRKYFSGEQLDGVTNYPFRNAIIDFVLRRDNTQLRRSVRELISDYPREAFLSIMNILGTHDTERILTALSNDKKLKDKDEKAVYVQSDTAEAATRLKIASVIQYMLPGVPCLYYGDEAGLDGYEDPFCRRCYPWEKEMPDLVVHYKKLGEIRNKYSSVFKGSTFDRSPSRDIFKLVRSDGVFTLTLVVNMSGAECDGGYDILSDKNGSVQSGCTAILLSENPKRFHL